MLHERRPKAKSGTNRTRELSKAEAKLPQRLESHAVTDQGDGLLCALQADVRPLDLLAGAWEWALLGMTGVCRHLHFVRVHNIS